LTQLGSHSNIIEYFGINKFENNMYMIFEYAEKGDLKKQLELYRKNFKLEMSNSYLNKTKIAYEIANGMEYISNLDIVYNNF
jgi:serine/threonine protein kinase